MCAYTVPDLPYNFMAEQGRSDKGARPVTQKYSDGDVLLLSACADAERAYEKQDSEDKDKRFRGMLTKVNLSHYLFAIGRLTAMLSCRHLLIV